MLQPEFVNPPRSPAGWAARIGLALCVVTLGYVGVTQSLAFVVAHRNPAMALGLMADNGRIAARLSTDLSNETATLDDRRRADALARQALKDDATAVAAVVTLGVNAEVRGDRAAAQRLFAYSQRLSRRNLATQLWALEDAVQRGDIPEALNHYDIALRVTPSAADLLFPILIAASTDPVIRAELVKTLSAKPGWGEAFINYAATNGKDPRVTALLLSDARRARVAVPDGARAATVNALIAGGQADLAWRFYSIQTGDSDRRMSRDPNFTANLAAPSRLDWLAMDDPGISASIQRNDKGGLFDFAASTGIGGAMLQQVQLLPAGTYRLVGRSNGIEQRTGAQPYWALTCHDGRVFGRVDIPNSSARAGRFEGRFIVPAGCGIQTLALIARPTDAPGGLVGQIEHVQLSPIS